jgi:hypothetical protein
MLPLISTILVPAIIKGKEIFEVQVSITEGTRERSRESHAFR